MITQADINSVYRDDMKQPYYSINSGRRPKRITRKQKRQEALGLTLVEKKESFRDHAVERTRSQWRRDWKWGHFPLALDTALRTRRSA